MFAPVAQQIPWLGTSGPTVNYQGFNPLGGPTTQPVTQYRQPPRWGTSGPTVDQRSPEQIMLQRNQTIGNVLGGLSNLPGMPNQMRMAGSVLQYLLQNGMLNPTIMR